MLRTHLSTALLLTFPGLAMADVPKVVTDIGPVHSLVSMVMEGLGDPDVLLTAGASPHDFALRPSQARSLSDAALVVWIGPELMPQLARQIETLADSASHLTLAAVEGTHVLPFREGGLIAHDHGHGDHDGEDHDEHGHDDHAEDHHDEHGHDEHADHGPDHIDPHLWLSPENAATWLTVIAEELATLDPDNATHYRVNAVKGANRIAKAESTARETLAPAQDAPLGVAHDAFQYFEEAFGLTVVGAISDGDDAAPGAARLDRVRAAYTETPPVCFMAEPETDTRLLLAVARESLMGKTMKLAEIDQLGAYLPQGAG